MWKKRFGWSTLQDQKTPKKKEDKKSRKPKEASGFFSWRTYGRHSDARPPERFRNALEFRMRLVLFGKVREAREYEDAHREKEHQEAELLVGIAEGEAQALQTRRVTRQLQNAQNAHYAKDLHDPAYILKLIRRIFVGLYEEEGDEVGQDREQIDNV